MDDAEIEEEAAAEPEAEEIDLGEDDFADANDDEVCGTVLFTVSRLAPPPTLPLALCIHCINVI
jgi:hypothetical protein